MPLGSSPRFVLPHEAQEESDGHLLQLSSVDVPFAKAPVPGTDSTC